MAADKNGHALSVGDKVYIPCTIVSIDDNQAYNLALESDEASPAGASKVPVEHLPIAIHSQQVILGTKHDRTSGLPEEPDPRLHEEKHKGGVSPVADMPVPDAIDHIGRMRSKDKLQDAIDCDSRVTVQKAAQARLDSLSNEGGAE
jgi:hypothetical protein